jgi:Mg-chelatase subunit ChlD
MRCRNFGGNLGALSTATAPNRHPAAAMDYPLPSIGGNMENNLETNATIIEVPRVTPAQKIAELGIFVTDGSGSMTGMAAGKLSKNESVNQAIRNTLSRFKVSSVVNNFEFAVISFSDAAKRRMEPTPAVQVDDLGNYDPLDGQGGGTSIWAGLEQAELMANEFLAREVPGGVPHGVCIIVLSDGCCSNPSKTKAVADRIKGSPNGARIKIASVFFSQIGQSDSNGEQLLQSLASAPALSKNVYDAETLRRFFTQSLSTAAGMGKQD